MLTRFIAVVCSRLGAAVVREDTTGFISIADTYDDRFQYQFSAAEDVLELHWAWIHPDLRGRGIGSRQIGQIVQTARLAGFRGIRIMNDINPRFWTQMRMRYPGAIERDPMAVYACTT